MDIALSRQVDEAAVSEVLTSVFPSCAVHVTTFEEYDLRKADVFVFIIRNDSEFPLGLSVSACLHAGCDFGEWLRELARVLSERFCAKAICDGTPYGDDGSPYWSLIWDDGLAYLADDINTLYSDGEGGPVRVVRKLDAVRSHHVPLSLWVLCGDNDPAGGLTGV